MITKISIKKTASYGDVPAVLETTKKVNLIYGINGAGKTVFSSFLANKSDGNFFDCLIEGLNGEKILVYNQHFIEENFYQKDIQKGIFTLSSENKEAEEKMKKATEKIQELNLKLKDEEKNNGFEINLDNKKNEIQNLLEKSKEKTWEIKSKYSGGDRILEFCLEGKKGSQDLLFEHIKKIQKTQEKPKKTIEELKKEAEATQGVNVKIYSEGEIKEIEFDFSEIEKINIFSEVIVGNENLQIAGLIKELNNADWVKQGFDYIEKPEKKEDSEELENKRCPFCQEETISNELYKQIEDYFDESYQNKITKLKELDSKYFDAWQKVKNKETEFLENDFIKNKEIEFKLLYKNFIGKLSSNWSKINEKIKTPSKIVNLESTISEKNDLNVFLNGIIQDIKSHNLKITNKQKTKKEIIDIFWEIMRWDYNSMIDEYNSKTKIFEEEKKEIENKISESNIQINGQKEIIRSAQKEIINIDNAINNINDELKFLGTEGFKIEKEGEDSYKIKRDNDDNPQFKTLSEGEKTIISFLYFLELCKGKESKEEVVVEKIIVIDDPISSLSHIYVFNITHLIRKTFFTDEYKQIFILTHSLYFFHELLFKSKQLDKKLFRIIKGNDSKSNILEMKQGEIQNDYQAYWQVLKDHDGGKSSNALLANSMRNILEHFFGFINNDAFQEITEKIEKEEKYKFFIRYINKESHSDLNTISDTKEIDPTIFKEAFKKIFIDSGYEPHYNKMMQ